MSTDNRSILIPGISGFLAGTIVLVTGTILLIQYGPGDMGKGFATGGTAGIIAFVIILWRVARRPQRTTSFERSFLGKADERDQRVATQAAAVVGVFSIPAVSVAAVAIAIGARSEIVLALLIYALLAVALVSFIVTARKS